MTACPAARHRNDPDDDTRGEPIWCESCTRRIVHTHHRLRALAAQLFADALLGTSDPAETVSGTPARRSPSPALDDLDELTRWVCAWADIALETAGRQARHEACPDLAAAHRTLTAELRRMLARPDLGVDLGREIQSVAAQLASRTKTGDQQQRMPMPCPRCGWRTLVREQGADHIGCTRVTQCGRLLSLPEYEQMAAALARSTPREPTEATRSA